MSGSNVEQLRTAQDRLPRQEALHLLGDDLLDLSTISEKLRLLAQDLTDDYFRLYDRDLPEDRIKIAWEYKRFAVCAEIMNDYIDNFHTAIERLISERTASELSR